MSPGAIRRITRHESWAEVTDMTEPLVTFRWTYVFTADGQALTSGSTLRFRERREIETELAAQGYEVEDVRDAPDRPGREFVFVARRPTPDAGLLSFTSGPETSNRRQGRRTARSSAN